MEILNDFGGILSRKANNNVHNVVMKTLGGECAFNLSALHVHRDSLYFPFGGFSDKVFSVVIRATKLKFR